MIKDYRFATGLLIGLFLLLVPSACRTLPEGPDSEQIRNQAEKEMQDLRIEEERHKK